MSKHDTVLKNLRVLTARRTLKSAATGWRVTKLGDLSQGGKWQTSELCGTRFQIGAWISHSQTESRIVVGGTCLDTILSQAFSDAREIRTRRRGFLVRLKRHYKGVVDPRARLNWLKDNAPPRLASAIAFILRLRTPRTRTDLEKLIRFHDRHRRFPRQSLFPDWRKLSDLVQIPDYITLQQYDEIQRKISELQPGVTAQLELDRYRTPLMNGCLRATSELGRHAPDSPRMANGQSSLL